MPEIFNTSAQYDDWVGKAAADNDVDDTINSVLISRGFISPDKFVVGIEMYVTNEMFASLTAYVVEADSADHAREALDGQNCIVQKISIEGISPDEFIRLFKRFSVVLSWHGMGLVDRSLNIRE